MTISFETIAPRPNEVTGIYYKLGIQATCNKSGELVRVFGDKRPADLIPDAELQLKNKLKKLEKSGKNKNSKKVYLSVEVLTDFETIRHKLIKWIGIHGRAN